MSSLPIEELVGSAFDILAPHALYMNKGSDDDVRYYLPADALTSLSWLAVHVVVPVLTSIATDLVRKHLKLKPPANDQEIEAIKRELAQAKEWQLELLHRPDRVASARDQLTLTLESNGWPSQAASKDAGAIVEVIRLRLQSHAG